MSRGAPDPGLTARPGSLASAFASFSIVPFRWVWLAALCGSSGRFAVILVAGWEAFRLGGHSALWPSLVSFFLFVPITVFGLVTGSYADRLNRAKLGAAGQAVSAAACAAAAAGVLAHAMSLGGVLVTAAVVGVGNSIQGPARQALIPALVGPDRMVNAALATRIAQQGSELVGPAMGTAVLTAAGPGWAFALCAGYYAVGGATLLHVRRHATRAPGGPRVPVRSQVSEGVGYIRRTRPIGLLLGWMACHCSLTMATFGILPTIAAVNFQGSAGAYGLLLTTFGAGSVLGPVWLMSVRRQPGPGWVLFATGVLSGAPLVALGLTHTEWLGMVMAALAGMGQAVFMSLIYASAMRCSLDLMRGRVSSVQLSLATGVMGMASLGWGALVPVLAVGLVLAAPGAVFVLICFALIGKVTWVNGAVSDQDTAVRAAEVARASPLTEGQAL